MFVLNHIEGRLRKVPFERMDWSEKTTELTIVYKGLINQRLDGV